MLLEIICGCCFVFSTAIQNNAICLISCFLDLIPGGGAVWHTQSKIKMFDDLRLFGVNETTYANPFSC